MRNWFRLGLGLLVSAGLLQACCMPLVVGSSPPQQPAYLWIAADMDAYVASAPSENLNMGGLDFLNIARSVVPGLTNERAYIHFTLPQLPAGTIIEQAYINLYENSRIDPGMATISIGWAQGPWSPATITWANQPSPPGPQGFGTAIGPFRNVDEWRGHPDSLHAQVIELVDGTRTNDGFIFDTLGPLASRRSFAADIERTPNTLGTAPRLLLKVRHETMGFNANTVTFRGPLPQQQDLCTPNGPFPLGAITMVQIAPGPGWPPAWGLAVQ